LSGPKQSQLATSTKVVIQLLTKFIPELREVQRNISDNTDLREILTKKRRSSGGAAENSARELKQNIQVCVTQPDTMNHDEKRSVTVSPNTETQQVIKFYCSAFLMLPLKGRSYYSFDFNTVFPGLPKN
jgi:hypothetical protein